jgi:Xaa-Pro dipeptidase
LIDAVLFLPAYSNGSSRLNYRKRREKLADRIIAKAPLDFVAITSLPSLRYFFNYAGNSYERFCCGILSTDGEKNALVIPKLDQGKAEKSSSQNVQVWTDAEGYSKALKNALLELGLEGKAVGCELGLTLGQMDAFKVATGASSFTAISEEISMLRQVKDSEEIESIRQSARILAKGYRAIPGMIQVEESEARVAMGIQKDLSEKGAEQVPFCAVQSGSNSAIPHSEATNKRIAKGDMIVIDVSIVNSDGYYSDFTRTYVVGKASVEQKAVHRAVEKAQAAAIRTCSSGKPAEQIDRAARKVIELAGFGQYFIHRTGHGLGLEVHEPPWINAGNNQELERGNVFTVEPGIYLPGKFGVRIEDDIIVEKGRIVDLTPLSRELVEI